jgi:hypothetical protein
MRNGRIVLILLVVAGCVLILLAGTVQASSSPSFLAAQPTPGGHIASPEELQDAYLVWLQSKHASTYDNGMGANTTCARCKSPSNWDPSSPAIDASLDCGACKRTPGAERPELTGGVSVPEADWNNIGCEICHPPAGDSFYTSIAFWDQTTQQYDPVGSVSDLCAHCHEGQHGFEVVEEQAASIAHQGWECTICHGPHGSPASCTDCHNSPRITEAPQHLQHPSVNCTACHDAGGLSIWLESDPSSVHYGQYITRRFAHALTSWPSHDISVVVNCLKCHHPLGLEQTSIVPFVSCADCHPDGASLTWCTFIPRDGDPYLLESDTSGGE